MYLVYIVTTAFKIEKKANVLIIKQFHHLYFSKIISG